MKKFLGAFFLSICLILSIAVVLDVSEKLDDFMEKSIPLKDIVFSYYLNFIPYMASLFAPLFVFISCIFFTSKMAENTEIIAIQAAGVSYRRMLLPYMLVATLIALLSFFLSSYVIPPANKERLDFQETLKKKKRATDVSNVQMEIEKGVVLTIKSYNRESKTGFSASLEKFNNKELVSRMTARVIKWDTLHNWKMSGYIIRDFDGLHEHLVRGEKIDTVLNVEPEEFFVYSGMEEQMTTPELKRYIDRQKSRGMGEVKSFEIEYAKRFASPFASFILTIIGVSLSSKKVRGGMGTNLGIGLFLSITYIFFFTISSTFAVSGSMSPTLAAWFPNILFIGIAFYCYSKAQK